jgi:hypothetical protein
MEKCTFLDREMAPLKCGTAFRANVSAQLVKLMKVLKSDRSPSLVVERFLNSIAQTIIISLFLIFGTCIVSVFSTFFHLEPIPLSNYGSYPPFVVL